jgi:hypothetical protein
MRSLRRFVFTHCGNDCPAGGYHDASAGLGRVTERLTHGDVWDRKDARWPTTCAACGYGFAVGDEWQLNDDAIYRLPDGAEFVFRGTFGNAAPPGTMIRAEWYDEFSDRPGQSWLISLPGGGEWITTQSATGGGHWTVTGTPPDITVNPSIWHNAPRGWHGFIRDGELVPA